MRHNLTVTIYEYGLFMELAITLAQQGYEVNYFNPKWKDAYPKSQDRRVGEGIEGVKRVNNFWDVFDDTDIFVFPDVIDGDVQLHLRGLGKRVWGSGKGEELELFRKQSKEFQKSLGIDIGPYEVIEGLDNLREHLKENENKWVKVSTTRGDKETLHAENYGMIEPVLDDWANELGAYKEMQEFIVEDDINPAVEIGIDTFCIDGQYPKGALLGLEVKGEGYVGIVHTSNDTIPSEILSINEKLAPYLAAEKYRNFITVSEARLTPDRKAYSVDPCCRFGSPPSEAMIYGIKNIGKIIEMGSGGILVEPEWKAKYAVEIILRSEWAEKRWQAIEFPKEHRDNIKLRNFCVVDGRYYVVPHPIGVSNLGAVVAMADSIEDAYEQCVEIAKSIKTYGLEFSTDFINKAKSGIEDLREWGMDINPKEAA